MKLSCLIIRHIRSLGGRGQRPLMGPVAIVLVAGTCLLASCATNQRREGESDYDRGKRLYEARCDACHDLYDPSEYTMRSAVDAVEEFGPRAGIRRDDRPLVIRYLQSHASDRPK